MNKTVLYLLYFCVYSLILLVIGKQSLHGGDNMQEYFLCRRRTNLFYSVCTFTGTWASAITILSLTGSVYEDGISSLLYSVFPWYLGGFLLAFISGKLYENDILTIPELFAKRYQSAAMQIIYGIFFACVYVFYLVSQYKGFGMVASELFGIPYQIAVFMVYLFILYTTFGGYRSVVRSDAFNLVLLLAGLGAMLIYITRAAGGFGTLYEKAGAISGFAHSGMQAATKQGGLLSLLGEKYSLLPSISVFFGWGLGVAANPQYTVRILGADSKKTARNTVLISLVILFFIYFAIVHIGLGMRVLVPQIAGSESTDGILIRLINNELYNPWSALFLFAVIGACISTANSQLLIIATSISYDVVRAIYKTRISDQRVLSVSRLAVVGAGTVAMLMTLNPPDFTLSYGGDIWGLLSILLLPAMYGTLFSKKITKGGIWACLITGTVAISIFYPLYYQARLSIHPALPGVFISTGSMLLVSYLERKRR